MANKKFNRKTTTEKNEELKELGEKALSQIEKYNNSPEDLLEYANFLSRFHSYSTENMALIDSQFKGAKALASFKTWSDKGYRINKGESGLIIKTYTPITKFYDKDGNIKQLYFATKQEKEKIKSGEIKTFMTAGYKKGHVYDISQTNCPVEDLPKVFPNKQFNFEIDKGNNIDSLRKGIYAVAESMDITIKDMKESELGLTELGVAKGVFAQTIYGKKEIVMNSRNTETQTLATSIHELAHAKLHSMESEGEKFDTPTKEFQAELTSYIVCKHFGMDTSEKAIPYIASWTKNGKKIEDKHRAIEGVHKTSREFIDIMDIVISREQEKELAKEDTIALDIPTVTFEWSENKNVPTEIKIPLPEADMFISNLNNKLLNKDGYYKTKFEIDFRFGEQDCKYEGRYDLGDEKGGLVDHIDDHINYALAYGDYSNDEQKESYQQLQTEVIPMFKKLTENKNIEEQEYKFPKDVDEVAYCELTGEAIGQDEPYYHLDGGTILSEKAHSMVFSDKDWEDLYTDEGENYYSEYDYDLPSLEMTTKKPDKLIDNNIYYLYNPIDRTPPEKLGTISDIVEKAENRKELDHFSFSKEFMSDFTFNKDLDKETFNGIMEDKYNVMKNPNLYDFQRVNEEEGLDKNINLETVIKDTMAKRNSLQNSLQR